MKITDVTVLKKDGTKENYTSQKVINAVQSSATRVMVSFTENELKSICKKVVSKVISLNQNVIEITQMHNIVESVLEDLYPEVAKSYRDYRNYKTNFVQMLDKVYKESQRIMYLGDKENANVDSALVSTKRSLIFNELNKQLYKNFFLTTRELQAIKDGYIYIHDMSARRDTMNCCLFDVATVLKGGFEMGNIWYNEPQSLDVAFDVIGDIVLASASQQYGGFTVPEVDKLLEPYARKSFDKQMKKYVDIGIDVNKAHDLAEKDLEEEFRQGFQGWEYKFNTVASSRGDYPFITITIGLGTSMYEKMATKTCLQTRANGQGKKGYKKPVLFPKIVFLYDEELHGEGKINEDLFEEGIQCSSKTMYPDWLSLTGEGYVASIYKKYKKVISPMGCRAFLSPWYERGGMKPADENDTPVFVGRFNIGAISLHLPMILAKSRQEDKDFYEVLDYYLELIRQLHIRTYNYLGEMRASVNPLAYCEGGFYGGHLGIHDKIRPILKSSTASFGITALNELQELYNGKSLVEDSSFALEVMNYIKEKINKYKEEDNILYAIYGTPAENLCFSGETIVQCYPENKKITDVKPGDLVYSVSDSGKIELKPVICSKMTNTNAVVVKVTLDNGQEFTCTPEHPIAVRKMIQDEDTGMIQGEITEYIQAKDLESGDRLRSNYIKINACGRPECSMYYNGNKQLIHNIVAEHFLGNKPEGYVVHHKDKNKCNNLFSNLMYMTDTEHRILHQEDNLKPFRYTKGSQLGKNNSFFGKKHTIENRELNRKAHIKDSVEQFDLSMKHIQHFECIQDTIKAGYTEGLVRQSCRGLRKGKPHVYKNHIWYYTKDCKDLLEKNHRVVKVEYQSDLIPVYNIEVRDNHNYIIGGNEGILVHNCGLQVKQFRKKFGIIEHVSDKPYVSNSFHCHVSEQITPIEKQDIEGKFWDTMNGGKIQYVRYPVSYNISAIRTLIRRAMAKGFYEGVNLALSYCDDCGYQQLDMDTCPKCGSKNLTKIDRMNGYLAYSRVKGDSRLADHKMEEIKDRVSM